MGLTAKPYKERRRERRCGPGAYKAELLPPRRLVEIF